MYDNAYSDYTGGSVRNCDPGLQRVHASFPRSDKADDAQLNIGNALLLGGQVPRGGRRISESDCELSAVATAWPIAYYKMGLTYQELRQLDLARKAFETVIRSIRPPTRRILAKQRLDA